MQKKLPEPVWNEIRTAYAAGIGLRETARNMRIPEGTVLARAKREGWTKGIAEAKAKARQAGTEQSNAITPAESAAISFAERGQRYVGQMAGVAEKLVPHVSQMAPAEILDRIEKVEKFDRVARRTFGLDDQVPKTSLININIGPAAAPAPAYDIDVTKL